MTEKEYCILAGEELGYQTDRGSKGSSQQSQTYCERRTIQISRSLRHTELSPVKHPQDSQGWALTNGPSLLASTDQGTDCQWFLNHSRNSES